MKKKEFKKDLLTSLRVKIGNEWNANFSRRAFFSKSWPGRRITGSGQLLDVSGALRGSIRSEVTAKGVRWHSSIPYAEIMNEGGEIRVTAKMKRFFWAKYYEHAGKIRPRKDGKTNKSSEKASAAATVYKRMALMKVGSKITIPERRFMGDAPEVNGIFREVCGETMKDVEKYLTTILNPKK